VELWEEENTVTVMWRQSWLSRQQFMMMMMVYEAMIIVYFASLTAENERHAELHGVLRLLPIKNMTR
jgi:hypothetical protein